MNLSDMISRRKSTRSYTGEPVGEALLNKIRSFMDGLQPLYPEIRVRGEIAGPGCVKNMMPWNTPQHIAIFSEEAEGWLENAGFMFQQLDLYLQSLGLGACWLGMGRLSSTGSAQLKRDDGLRYVIAIAFGHPRGSALRSPEAFSRKEPGRIADRADPRLEPARLAPSSINSQPWYFTHEGEVIHAWCVRPGPLMPLGYMNRIDMGIALGQLYAANPDSFRFFRAEPPALKKHVYIGSFTL